MTYRELLNKFNFYLELEQKKRKTDIEFTEAEKVQLVFDGVVNTMKELGATALNSYTPTSSTPTLEVTMPSNFGVLKEVEYDGEVIASFEYRIVVKNAAFVLVFNKQIIPNLLKVKYYSLSKELTELWRNGASAAELLTSAFVDTEIIPLPENFQQACVYGALSIVFPDTIQLFIREVSLLKSWLTKPEKVEANNKAWSL